MKHDQFTGKSALVTGGTSGLGKSIALQLKQRGCEVVVIGTNGKGAESDGLSFLQCDFASFKSVMSLVEAFSVAGHSIDFLINNAGILSPPIFTESKDGFELTYQVNFLSHVLLTRSLLEKNILNSPVIINTSSPIYKSGVLNGLNHSVNSYSIIKAYANSKLYLALFSEQLAIEGIRGFAFNPGTFSSGIYRSQKNWFHKLYKVASPFMISADSVASKMFKILEGDRYSNGAIISKTGAEIRINKFSDEQKVNFWGKINSQLNRYF